MHEGLKAKRSMFKLKEKVVVLKCNVDGIRRLVWETGDRGSRVEKLMEDNHCRLRIGLAHGGVASRASTKLRRR